MAFTPGQVLTAAQMNALEAATLPTAAITMYGASSAPTGYLLCDGAAVNRTTYAALFTAIGTTYGAGNGSTTFNVPNLKGRVPVGLDSGDASFDVLGEIGGAKTHTLTSSEMPSHTHTQNSHSHSGTTDNGLTNGQMTIAGGAGTTYASNHATGFSASPTSTTFNNDQFPGGNHDHAYTTNSVAATNQNTGGGSAHNNLQPYIAINFIIKT